MSKTNLSRGTAFLTRVHVHPAKTLISLRIRTVRSASLQGTLWAAKNPKHLHEDSEDSDQPAQLAGCTLNHVGNAVPRLKLHFMLSLLCSIVLFTTKTSLFNYIENFTTKKWKISEKKIWFFFHISAQNIDCGYSLEPPRRGGSNECPQSMFWAEIRKIMYTPVNSSFNI